MSEVDPRAGANTKVQSSVRLIHVVEGLGDQLGGLQTAVVAMASAQSLLELDVTIVAGKNTAEQLSGLGRLDPGVSLRRFGYSPVIRRFNGSVKLLRHLWRWSPTPDVVHVHGLWNISSAGGALYAIQRGIPLVISPHGSLESYDLKKHARAKRVLGRMFIRPLLRRVDLVLCTSEREASGLTTYGATVSALVIPLPPVPLEAPTMKPDEFLSHHGIPKRARVLLFLGRLDPKKGLHHLVEAMTLLADDVHLVVAGGGEERYEQELRTQVADCDLSSRVHFIGWLSREQKSDAYHSADLFVLLSHNENYGITAVEAAQAGLPSVLTADVYSSQELVNAGAAVVTTRDPDDAARAISGLLHDTNRLEDLRAGCRALLATELNGSRIAERYYSLARDLASGRYRQ